MLETMKRYLRIALSALLLATGSSWSVAYAKTWYTISSEQASDSKVVLRQPDVEVRSSRGAIIVTTNKPIQIKVYSILGQLVAQDTLQAGTFRMGINAHGIYIVKIGDLTCKVAV